MTSTIRNHRRVSRPLLATMSLILILATPLQAHGASCTGGATRSASSTISDPWSVFDGCVLSAASTIFDFGALPVSTAAPFGLRMARTTVPIVGGGAVVEVRGAATATAHTPLDILITNSTYLNAMLKITLFMPAGSRIAVQNTTFLNSGQYIDPGFDDPQHSAYVVSALIFLGNLTLNDRSALVLSNINAQITRVSSGTYNFGCLWTSRVNLTNGSSVAIADSRWVSEGGGSTWDVYALRFWFRFHGSDNAFSVTYSHVEASAGGSDGQTFAAIGGLLAVGTPPESSFGMFWNISRCTVMARGVRSGQALFVNPASYVSLAVTDSSFSGERTTIHASAPFNRVIHMVRRDFQHGRLIFLRTTVTTPTPALMTDLILFHCLNFTNTTFAFIENTLGTSPTAAVNIVAVSFSATTPESFLLQGNTIQGNTALALPRLMTGYASPMLTIFCRNRYYGTKLLTQPAYLAAGVTDIGPSNTGAARYWCGSATPEQTPTASASPTVLVSTTRKITGPSASGPTASRSAEITTTRRPPHSKTVSPSVTVVPAPTTTASVTPVLTKTTGLPPTSTATSIATATNTHSVAVSSFSTIPTRTASSTMPCNASIPLESPAAPILTATARMQLPADDATAVFSVALPTTTAMIENRATTTDTSENKPRPVLAIPFFLAAANQSAVDHAICVVSSLSPPPNDLLNTSSSTTTFQIRCTFVEIAALQASLQRQHAAAAATATTVEGTNAASAVLTGTLPEGTLWQRTVAVPLSSTSNCTVRHRSPTIILVLTVWDEASSSLEGGTAAAAVRIVKVLLVVEAPVFGVLFVDPTAVEAQLLTVLLLSPCASPSHHNAAAIAQYLLSPFAGAGARVVVAVHTALAVAVVGGHLLFTAYLLRRRQGSVTSHDDPEHTAPPSVGIVAVLAAARFPGPSFACAMLLYPGAAHGTAVLVRSGGGVDAALVVFATVLFLIPLPALAAGLLFRVAAPHAGSSFALAARDASTKEGDLCFNAPRHVVLRRLWMPIGHWEDTDRAGLERRGLWSVRGFTAPRGQLQAVASTLVLLVTCVLAASPRGASCRGQLATASALFGIFAVAVGAMRPYTTRLSDGLTVAAYAGLCGLAAAIAAGATSDASPAAAPPTQAALVVGLLFAILTIVCTFARTAHWGHLLFLRMRQPDHHALSHDLLLDADENMVSFTTVEL